MSAPRRIRPGSIVMVTRRTLRRTHLLRPDPELNALFTYCLAVLAPRFGILVHAVVLMSTHEHMVLTDTRGQLPCFLRDLHRLVALGVKVLRKWEGAVWDHEKTSVVELLSREAVVEKLAYVMANPVAAGLVRRAAQWPGIMTLPEHLGRSALTAARPDYFFNADNPAWPQTASLQLTEPTLGMDELDLRRCVEAELEALERAASEEVATKGRSFMDRERLMRLSPYDRATTGEPLRARNPTFAVGRGQRDAFFHEVTALRTFRKAYRAALDLWRTGMRSVLFPVGTWLMVSLHAAPVAPA
jgi:putative transposase